jgi:hypothetical protein
MHYISTLAPINFLMKILTVFALSICPFLVLGQVHDSTFLMYDRILGYGYNAQHELVSVDTSFSARGVFTVNKSNAYIRDYFFINSKTERKQKWSIKRDGRNVTITKGDKVKEGIIIRDSVLNWKKYSTDSTKFFIVPLGTGVRFNRFKGQLVSDDKEFTSKIILGDLDYRGLQETSVYYESDSFAIAYDGLTKYTKAKYNNLVSVGPRNEFLQLQDVISDTILLMNSFTVGLRAGEKLKSHVQLIKRSFPVSATVNKLKDNLQGNWNLVSGRVYNDSTSGSRKLWECDYHFTFRGDSLFIMRRFLEGKYDNIADSTIWTVNPTGDFVSIRGHSKLSNPNIILKQISERSATWVIEDIWIKNKKRVRVGLVLEVEKINRR